MLEKVISELEKGIDPDRAEHTQHYFGIRPGGYGEGDILLGIRSPHIRSVAREYQKLPLKDVTSLLVSPVHEFRFCALAILVLQYPKQPEACLKIFLDNINHVNNWDLVDCFSPHILGRWCYENHDESILKRLNADEDLWHRRISLVSYMAFYRKGAMGDGLEMIDNRLDDPEDLMHKACGWMLRDIYSKVDKHVIESYLIDNYSRLSRTTLRYAIEHMPEDERQKYLKGKF